MVLRVTVQYFTFLKGIVGKGAETFEFHGGASVGDIWVKVLEKYGTEMEKAGYVDPVTKEPKSILVALRRIGVLGLKQVGLYDGLKTELNEGDMVAIYPPVMGG